MGITFTGYNKAYQETRCEGIGCKVFAAYSLYINSTQDYRYDVQGRSKHTNQRHIGIRILVERHPPGVVPLRQHPDIVDMTVFQLCSHIVSVLYKSYSITSMKISD